MHIIEQYKSNINDQKNRPHCLYRKLVLKNSMLSMCLAIVIEDDRDVNLVLNTIPKLN